MTHTILDLLLMLFLGACTTTLERDLWGNRYPTECQGDLSDVHLPVVRVRHGSLPFGVLAVCMFCNKPEALAMIDDSLTDEQAAEALKHERCHRKRFLMGRDMRWHAEPVRR